MAQGLQIAGARTLITGASGGIGAALARRLRADGAELILTGRRGEILDELAAELGGTAIVCDLIDSAGPGRLLSEVGRVDILIANAALPASGRLATLDPARLDGAIAVNLRAPMALAHGLLAQMSARGAGHMVFIGSLQSRAATVGASVYTATKFGLRGFALSLRADLAGSGIGVSHVMPGFVSDAGLHADSAVKLPPWIGTRRPDQVAEAVVDAIGNNRGEVEVAPLPMRAGTAIAALAPEFSARAARLLGADRIAREFERGQADKR
jgi:short-subunit dehydrogenase